MEQDFVEEMIEESIKRDPEFAVLIEEAEQRQALLNNLATLRAQAKISKKTLAKRLKRSMSAIKDLETGSIDPYLSTVQRYAAIIGKRLEWSIVDAQPPENSQIDTPPVS